MSSVIDGQARVRAYERITAPIRRKQKTITIEPEEVEVCLKQMMDAAEAGRVIKGALHIGDSFHCTLGLVEVVTSARR